ncbi:MAG: hypothetical protein ACKOX6_15865 [Bdellovibrio sp.]
MNPNALAIEVCKSVEEAPDYRALGGYDAADLSRVVIVKNGTQNGNPTVDLVFTDKNGNKYVAMITGKLFKAAAQLVGDTDRNESMT